MTIPTTAGRLRVKHVRRHVPTSRRQRFYLVEVLIGLGVTGRHFFGNLGRWRVCAATGVAGERRAGFYRKTSLQKP